MTEPAHVRELLELLRSEVREGRAETKAEMRLLGERVGALERMVAGEVGATSSRRTLWPQIVSAAVGVIGVTVALVSLVTR